MQSSPVSCCFFPPKSKQSPQHPVLCVTFRNKLLFYSDELVPRSTPKVEDHPLSAVPYSLFNIFTTLILEYFLVTGGAINAVILG